MRLPFQTNLGLRMQLEVLLDGKDVQNGSPCILELCVHMSMYVNRCVHIHTYARARVHVHQYVQRVCIYVHVNSHPEVDKGWSIYGTY